MPTVPALTDDQNWQQNQTLPGPAPTPVTPPSQSLDSVERAPVAPARTLDQNESVEGRLTGLLESNSTLQQQARTQGLQEAQSRGLLNSSIAVGAAQDAASRAALPIAQQDAAQLYDRNQQRETFGAQREQQQRGLLGESAISAQQSVQAESLTRVQGAIEQLNMLAEYESKGVLSVQEAQQERDKLSQQYGLQSGLSAQEASQELARQSEGLSQQLSNQQTLNEQARTINLELANFNADQAKQMAQIGFQYDTLLRSSDQAASMFSMTNTQISSILQNPDVKKKDKEAAIANVVAYMNDWLNMQGALLEAAGLEVEPHQLPSP